MVSPRNTLKIKIFVSSTYQDLRSHREHCIAALNRLKEGFNIDWVGMEAFGADDSSPKDHCLEKVRQSDVYVGIFGMRYGHMDDNTGKSITELEYREARKSAIPCLIYLIDEDRAQINPKDVDVDVRALKLSDLKKELRDLTKGHVVGHFHSADHLATQLATDIPEAVMRLEQRSTVTRVGLRNRIEEAIDKGVQFIRDMENRTTGGWSYFEVGSSTCYDTAYSILALVASEAEEMTAQLHRGQHWLMATRNRLGGWKSPWEHNPDASNAVDTAIALCALSQSGYEEQPWEVQRSTTYLLDAQQSHGGWAYVVGGAEPATAATAWAVRALVSVGLSASDGWAQRARQWLIDNQRHDGGWGADASSVFSTIGKTRDALMALSVLGLKHTDDSIARARRWLLEARASRSSTDDFAMTIGVEPQGVNPLVENIVYLLEAAFYAGVSAGEESIKNDLEWLTGRRLWSFTPQTVWCLSQYRKWVS